MDTTGGSGLILVQVEICAGMGGSNINLRNQVNKVYMYLALLWYPVPQH